MCQMEPWNDGQSYKQFTHVMYESRVVMQTIFQSRDVIYNR